MTLLPVSPRLTPNARRVVDVTDVAAAAGFLSPKIAAIHRHTPLNDGTRTRSRAHTHVLNACMR